MKERESALASGKLLGLLLLEVGDLVDSLHAHDATAPLAVDVVEPVVEVVHDGLAQLAERGLVARAHVGEAKCGGRLLVDDGAEAGLGLLMHGKKRQRSGQ